MKSLDENYYNPFFSHIYVEEEIAEHPRVKQILARFMKAEIVYIRHYKDVFCRRRQDYEEQHHAQNLILAKKTGSLIYQGAPVCQNFGNTYFYYTSCMMNCIYDCEYCYLKGMYPSANIVIFVNIEDIFEELHRMLSEHPVYLCVSYDTDLLAFEAMTGYVREWEHFVLEENKRSTYPLKIEIRTKSANVKLFDNLIPDKNIIYAFTLSPQQITKQYEHNTPSLLQRVRCVADAVKKGFPVRLHRTSHASSAIHLYTSLYSLSVFAVILPNNDCTIVVTCDLKRITNPTRTTIIKITSTVPIPSSSLKKS